MKFGSREVCDVVLRAKAKQKLGSRTFYKGEPVLYFDSLTATSLEGASTTAYAQGGHGYVRRIAWEGERTITWNMTDCLMTPESIAILSGADLIDATAEKPMYVHTTATVEVKAKNTIVLPEIACWNGEATGDQAADYKHAEADIFCMVMDNGEVNVEPCVPAAVAYADGKTTITCFADGAAGHTDLAVGSIVLVDYYVKKTNGVMQIEITPDKFAGNYYLEGSTLFRRESDGVDMPAEFIIPNGKIQSNFTFSMASNGDPSTLDFVMDAFPDYTKFDKTKKVMTCIQIIDESEGEAETKREACNANP